MSRHHQANEDTDDGFLKRWSRRKANPATPTDEPVQGETEGAELPEHPGEEPASANGNPAAEAEERVMTDEDMPDLDTISESTDMSCFFSPGVSEALRKRALRRLFRLPKFNVTDGLDDYNEDFRNFEALGGVITSDMRPATEGVTESNHGPQQRGQLPADERKQSDRVSEEAGRDEQVAVTEGESDESPATDAPQEEVDSEEAPHRGVDT